MVFQVASHAQSHHSLITSLLSGTEKVSQGHFGHSSTHLWSHSFPQGALFLLANYRYLETRSGPLVYSMLLGCHCLLGPLSQKVREKVSMYNVRRHLTLLFCSLGFKALPNNISWHFNQWKKEILFPLPSFPSPHTHNPTPTPCQVCNLETILHATNFKSTVEELHEFIPLPSPSAHRRRHPAELEHRSPSCCRRALTSREPGFIFRNQELNPTTKMCLFQATTFTLHILVTKV